MDQRRVAAYSLKRPAFRPKQAFRSDKFLSDEERYARTFSKTIDLSVSNEAEELYVSPRSSTRASTKSEEVHATSGSSTLINSTQSACLEDFSGRPENVSSTHTIQTANNGKVSLASFEDEKRIIEQRRELRYSTNLGVTDEDLRSVVPIRQDLLGVLFTHQGIRIFDRLVKPRIIARTELDELIVKCVQLESKTLKLIKDSSSQANASHNSKVMTNIEPKDNIDGDVLASTQRILLKCLYRWIGVAFDGSNRKVANIGEKSLYSSRYGQYSKPKRFITFDQFVDQILLHFEGRLKSTISKIQQEYEQMKKEQYAKHMQANNQTYPTLLEHRQRTAVEDGTLSWMQPFESQLGNRTAEFSLQVPAHSNSPRPPLSFSSTSSLLPPMSMESPSNQSLLSHTSIPKSPSNTLNSSKMQKFIISESELSRPSKPKDESIMSDILQQSQPKLSMLGKYASIHALTSAIQRASQLADQQWIMRSLNNGLSNLLANSNTHGANGKGATGRVSVALASLLPSLGSGNGGGPSSSNKNKISRNSIMFNMMPPEFIPSSGERNKHNSEEKDKKDVDSGASTYNESGTRGSLGGSQKSKRNSYSQHSLMSNLYEVQITARQHYYPALNCHRSLYAKRGYSLELASSSSSLSSNGNEDEDEDNDDEDEDEDEDYVSEEDDYDVDEDNSDTEEDSEMHELRQQQREQQQKLQRRRRRKKVLGLMITVYATPILGSSSNALPTGLLPKSAKDADKIGSDEQATLLQEIYRTEAIPVPLDILFDPSLLQGAGARVGIAADDHRRVQDELVKKLQSLPHNNTRGSIMVKPASGRMSMSTMIMSAMKNMHEKERASFTALDRQHGMSEEQEIAILKKCIMQSKLNALKDKSRIMGITNARSRRSHRGSILGNDHDGDKDDGGDDSDGDDNDEFKTVFDFDFEDTLYLPTGVYQNDQFLVVLNEVPDLKRFIHYHRGDMRYAKPVSFALLDLKVNDDYNYNYSYDSEYDYGGVGGGGDEDHIHQKHQDDCMNIPLNSLSIEPSSLEAKEDMGRSVVSSSIKTSSQSLSHNRNRGSLKARNSLSPPSPSHSPSPSPSPSPSSSPRSSVLLHHATLGSLLITLSSQGHFKNDVVS